MTRGQSAVVRVLALAGICAMFVWYAAATPTPVSESATAGEFSAGRAMTHVRAIAQRPHPSGSVDHARVREYLEASLRSLGLDRQIQDATGVGTHNTVAGRVQNVLARLPGAAARPAVLLVAHYDSVPAAPGAGDDAAGVAAILETLRALRAGPPLAHDVIALFSDGEEGGLTGAAAFVREHPWAADVGAILNFEGRGNRGASVMFETGAGNLDAVRALQRVPQAVAASFGVSVYRLLPNDTDVSELVALGQPTLNFAFSGGVERYHSASDDAAHLDPGSLQHHGVLALALARAFANGPLPRPRTADAVFFNLPGVGLVVYPESAASAIAVLALATVILAVRRARRRDAHAVRGMAFGFAGTIVSPLIACVVAIGAGAVFEDVAGDPSFGHAAASRALYAIAIVLLTLSAASAAWTAVRRRVDAASAWTGVLLVWTIAALALTWMLPGASYLFVWPLFAAAIAAVAPPVALWGATLVALAIIVPAVYHLAFVVFAMSTPGVIVVAVFVPMTAWLLLPHLEGLSSVASPRRTAAVASAAVVLLAVAIVRAQFAADHRQPSMLGYAYDADTSRAWLVALADFEPSNAWDVSVVGRDARTVIPGAASTDAAPEWLTRAIAGPSRTLAAAAPSVAVGVPELLIVGDETKGDTRHLQLRVRPAQGTYSIRLRAVSGRVTASTVDGRPIDASRYRSRSGRWTLGFVAPPRDGFALTIEVTKGEPLELEIIARSLGLPPLPNVPPRPPDVEPVFAGDQTIVYRRVRL